VNHSRRVGLADEVPEGGDPTQGLFQSQRSRLWELLKRLDIRTTLQVLTEQAHALYLGGQVPPACGAATLGPTGFRPTPNLPTRQANFDNFRFGSLAARSAGPASGGVEAEISDQELAVEVFDWYVRKGLVPQPKETVKRKLTGLLHAPKHLVALEFRGLDDEMIMKALDLAIDPHTRFGGPLGNEDGELCWDETGERRLTEAEHREILKEHRRQNDASAGPARSDSLT